MLYNAVLTSKECFINFQNSLQRAKERQESLEKRRKNTSPPVMPVSPTPHSKNNQVSSNSQERPNTPDSRQQSNGPTTNSTSTTPAAKIQPNHHHRSSSHKHPKTSPAATTLTGTAGGGQSGLPPRPPAYDPRTLEEGYSKSNPQTPTKNNSQQEVKKDNGSNNRPPSFYDNLSVISEDLAMAPDSNHISSKNETNNENDGDQNGGRKVSSLNRNQQRGRNPKLSKSNKVSLDSQKSVHFGDKSIYDFKADSLDNVTRIPIE